MLSSKDFWLVKDFKTKNVIKNKNVKVALYLLSYLIFFLLDKFIIIFRVNNNYI